MPYAHLRPAPVPAAARFAADNHRRLPPRRRGPRGARRNQLGASNERWRPAGDAFPPRLSPPTSAPRHPAFLRPRRPNRRIDARDHRRRPPRKSPCRLVIAAGRRAAEGPEKHGTGAYRTPTHGTQHFPAAEFAGGERDAPSRVSKRRGVYTAAALFHAGDNRRGVPLVECRGRAPGAECRKATDGTRCVPGAAIRFLAADWVAGRARRAFLRSRGPPRGGAAGAAASWWTAGRSPAG